MSDYYDSLETRSAEDRDAAQMFALAKQIARAQSNASYYADTLRDVAAEEINNRHALARLPLTRKSALMELQRETPPFGGLNATPVGELSGIYMSPGPIADPQGHGADWWRMGRALFAAGVRRGDRILNCFSYHHTPAGAMFEAAASALGCPVYPGGTGQSQSQVEAISHYGLNAYVGTPDFLKIILDKAEEMKVSVASLDMASVGGGALFPAMRKEYADRGITVLQSYGTADLGLVAYESPALEGMIVDEGVIVEIVRPGTGDPVADGEVGEVVVTALNADYPLIRFATGDLSAVLAGQSPCGRTGPRIKGWMGRADQTTKVKGMFVHPEQIAAVLKRHPEIVKVRLVVTAEEGRDVMTLCCEAPATADQPSIAVTLQELCKLKGAVELVEPGTLPNDGRIIDDQRTYD